MPNHKKFDNLIIGLENKKQSDLVKYNELQAKYKEIMGSDDSNIKKQIANLDKIYDEKVKRLHTHYQRFKDMMNLPDSELRIISANEFLTEGGRSIDDYVYHPLTKEKIELSDYERNEILARKAANYGSIIFPALSSSREIEVIEPRETREISLPEVARLHIVTVRNELDTKSGDIEFTNRVSTAINYIKTQVGNRYNLISLTSEELFGLEDALKEYQNSDSSKRRDFLDMFLSSDLNSTFTTHLSGSELSTIKYALSSQSKSDLGEYRKMKPETEQKLAGAILKSFSEMTDRNGKYRIAPIDIPELIDGNKAPVVLFVEKYINDFVEGRRLPLLTENIYKNLLYVLDFNKRIDGVLSAEEMDELDVGYHTKTMDNLADYYKRNNRLTYKQIDFAFDLMAQYSQKLIMAPESIKTKIDNLNNANINNALISNGT